MDGGSTDSTIDIVEEFSASHAGIKWVSQKDNGVYDAMNKGIAASTGDWLYFLGCDDLLYSNDVLQEVANRIDDRLDVVYGDVVLNSNLNKYAGAFDLERLLNQFNICHQAIFYKKEVFNKLGMYNLKYKIWADWDFNIRCFKHPDLKIEYIDYTVARYNDLSGVSSVHDEIFIRELPLFYVSKTAHLQLQNEALLKSKSFLLGNKIIKFAKIFGFKFFLNNSL